MHVLVSPARCFCRAAQVVLTLFGLLRGLLRLELGVLNTWRSMVAEFHRAPARFMHKSVSKVNKHKVNINK